MSVAALTRAARVNRTAFYSHFSSPENLAIHALRELFGVVVNADIVMRASRSVPAEEASRRALHDIVRFTSADVRVKRSGPRYRTSSPAAGAGRW